MSFYQGILAKDYFLHFSPSPLPYTSIKVKNRHVLSYDCIKKYLLSACCLSGQALLLVISTEQWKRLSVLQELPIWWGKSSSLGDKLIIKYENSFCNIGYIQYWTSAQLVECIWREEKSPLIYLCHLNEIL